VLRARERSAPDRPQEISVWPLFEVTMDATHGRRVSDNAPGGGTCYSALEETKNREILLSSKSETPGHRLVRSCALSSERWVYMNFYNDYRYLLQPPSNNSVGTM
jgi:hypothetical protein